MTPQLEVDSQQFERMIALLREEQKRLKSHFALYRLFYAAVVLFLACAIAAVTVPSRAWSGWLSSAAVATSGAVIILFVLNLPYLIDLMRLAARRRRLGLEPGLVEVTKRFGKDNPILFLLAVLGTVVVIGSLRMLFELGRDAYRDPSLSGRLYVTELVNAAGPYLVLLFLGAALLSLYVMKRGKQRYELVERMSADLLPGRKGGDLAQREAREPIETAEREPARSSPLRRSGPIKLSEDEYDLVAALERASAIDARSGIPKRAAKLKKSKLYALHRTPEAEASLWLEDWETRERLEKALRVLTREPRPAEAREMGDDLEMVVPATGHLIRYTVDDRREAIRLLSVAPIENRPGGVH